MLQTVATSAAGLSLSGHCGRSRRPRRRRRRRNRRGLSILWPCGRIRTMTWRAPKRARRCAEGRARSRRPRLADRDPAACGGVGRSRPVFRHRPRM